MEENNVEAQPEVIIEEKHPFNLIQFIKDIEIRFLILFGLIAIPLVFGGIVLVNDQKGKMAAQTELPTPTITPSPTVNPEATATPVPTTAQRIATPTLTKAPTATKVPQPTKATQPTAIPTNKPASDLQVYVNAMLFSDNNCNGKFDGNDTYIKDQSTTTYLWRMPEFSMFANSSSMQDGQYILTGYIKDHENVEFQVSAVSPAGYKSQGGIVSLTLNKGNSSTSVNIPQVPYDNIGACSQ